MGSFNKVTASTKVIQGEYEDICLLCGLQSCISKLAWPIARARAKEKERKKRSLRAAGKI